MQISIAFQINIVNERKESLERKIALLVGEREGLSYNLDETSEKILMLERNNREQENKVRKRRPCNAL
jgi:predicted  nucleic acid-binding Zn-ribbon protein